MRTVIIALAVVLASLAARRASAGLREVQLEHARAVEHAVSAATR